MVKEGGWEGTGRARGVRPLAGDSAKLANPCDVCHKHPRSSSACRKAKTYGF